jgi:hypothetical protein
VATNSKNLTRLSKDQLYKLLAQNDLSDSDFQVIKSELVRREADNFYNQAMRSRGTETSKKSKNRAWMNQAAWIVIIVLIVFFSFIIYFSLH